MVTRKRNIIDIKSKWEWIFKENHSRIREKNDSL